MNTDYFIGGGDFMGNDGPNEIFNTQYVPRLLELGIHPENMDEIAQMFRDVYNIGFSNGDNVACALSDESA